MLQGMATGSLDRARWVEEALLVWGESGLARVAVEPLATRLGATKGSFYWHFRNRAELIDATLEHWATRATREVIEAVRRAPSDRRPEAMIDAAFDPHGSDPAERMILAAADDPQVAPVVAQVHKARVDFLRELFTEQGLTPARADARARVLYATYLGHLQFSLGSPARAARLGATIRTELIAMMRA